MKYVRFGDQIGIEVEEREDGTKRIITDKNGLPGSVFVKKTYEYKPSDKEKLTLDQYYEYYKIAKSNSNRNYSLNKASEHNTKIPKVITVHRDGKTFQQVRMVLPETSKAHLDDKEYNQIVKGDKNTLAKYLYRALYSKGDISSYAKKSLGGYNKYIDADDVIQDTYMVMMKKQETNKLREISNKAFTSYVSSVIQNIARDYYKKYRKEESIESSEISDKITSKQEDIDETNIVRQVGHNVMSSIKNQLHKKIFKEFLSSEDIHKEGEHWIEGKTQKRGNVHSKIASKFNITENASKQVIKKVNNLIRKEMEKQGYSGDQDAAKVFRDLYRKKIGQYQELQKARALADRIKLHGMDISIENNTGQMREGIDDDGNNWAVVMGYPYGYIRGTVGADGDHVDCFVGPKINSDKVYIVHQNKPDGSYDEDKVFIGFDSKSDVRNAYFDHYDRTDLYGNMTVMQMDEFKESLSKNKGKKLQKGGKKAEIGTIREYNGVKYKKVSEGKWEKVSKSPGKDTDSKPKEKQSPKNKKTSSKQEKQKGIIKSALKSIVNMITDVLSGREPAERVPEAISEAKQSNKNKTINNKNNGDSSEGKEKRKDIKDETKKGELETKDKK